MPAELRGVPPPLPLPSPHLSLGLQSTPEEGRRGTVGYLRIIQRDVSSAPSGGERPNPKSTAIPERPIQSRDMQTHC